MLKVVLFFLYMRHTCVVVRRHWGGGSKSENRIGGRFLYQRIYKKLMRICVYMYTNILDLILFRCYNNYREIEIVIV